jgi:hypothetical protein
VIWAQIVAPLLIRNEGVKALLAATLTNAFGIPVQVVAAFLVLELPGVGLTTRRFPKRAAPCPCFSGWKGAP